MAVVRAPEFVGDGDDRIDVANFSDRAVSIMSFDMAVKGRSALRTFQAKFQEFLDGWAVANEILMRELPEYKRRIEALETRVYVTPMPLPGAPIPTVPAAPPVPSIPAERESHHDWDDILQQAARTITERVKDPKDRLDSKRARAIAEEVVSSAKTASDAASFRAIKSNGVRWALEALKYIGVAIVTWLAAKHGITLK